MQAGVHKQVEQSTLSAFSKLDETGMTVNGGLLLNQEETSARRSHVSLHKHGEVLKSGCQTRTGIPAGLLLQGF